MDKEKYNTVYAALYMYSTNSSPQTIKAPEFRGNTACL